MAFGEPILLQRWLEEQAGSTALGEAVTAGIRGANVLPTAALLVGALCERQWRSSSSSSSSAGKAAALAGSCDSADRVVSSCRPAGAPAPAADVLAGMEWLAGQLEQRGAAVVRLPHATPAAAGPSSSSGGSGAGKPEQEASQRGHERQQALLLHLAGMLPQCCEASQTTGGAAAALALRRGVEAALLQHSRLNQLLPALAAEGLVAAALLGCGDGAAVGRAELLDAAAWLRCVLAPEIDTG